MSAVVIAFPGNRTSACCGGKTKKSLQGWKRRPQLKMQMERIALLLDELEDIAPHSGEASATLARARASICKVEERLSARGLDHSAPPPVVEDERNPQPHIDREVLERFFHSLDPYQ